MENRQPYNVFEQEKIENRAMEAKREAAREMRDIDKAKQKAAMLADKVGGTRLGHLAENSLVGQVAGAAFSEVNSLRLKRAKKKRKMARGETNFVAQLKDAVGLGPEPSDSQWVKLHLNRGEESSDAGEVLMSIELMPRSLANELAAGSGRSEPNDHPRLPPPVGRFDPTQLFNPLYAVQQVLGDNVTGDVIGLIICAVITFVIILVGPFFTTYEKSRA